MASTVKLSLPVLERPPGYLTPRVDCKLTPRQAKALGNLAYALDAQQARTKDGRRVVTNQDAVRWLMDELADVQSEAGVPV